MGTLFAALVLVLPGTLLVRREEWARGDVLGIVSTATFGSLALLAVALWFLPSGASLLAVAAGLNCAGAVALVLAIRRAGREGRLPGFGAALRSPEVAIVLGGTVVLAALRLAMLATRAGPSIGDLTMHAYMTELIRLADGLPSSHEPLLPISTFGQNSPGMHAAAAVVAMATDLEADRAALLVGAFALAILPLALARVVRAWMPDVSPAAAFAGCAALTLFARHPQLFVPWGGLPTIASFGLVLLVLAEIPRLVAGFAPAVALRTGALAAAAVLTHLLPVVAAIYAAALLVVVETVRKRPRVRDLLVNGVLAAGAAFLLTLPFQRRTALLPSADTVEWARGWFRTELAPALYVERTIASALGIVPDGAGVATFPFQVVFVLGTLTTGVLGAWLVLPLARRTPGGPARRVAWLLLALTAVLFAASLFEFLPLWWALYPTRATLLLLVPAALAFSAGTHAVASRGRRAAAAAAAGVAAVLGASFVLHERTGRALPVVPGAALWQTYRDSANARVGDDDRAAFAWIRANTPPEAVFDTNVADGGHLIPAATHRKIRSPHFQFMWYGAEVAAWQASHPADHFFVGADPSPVHPVRLTAAALDAEPARYVLIHASGRARIYRIVP